MPLVDELKIKARAGKGGDGVVRWLHEKNREFGGPCGGNGGQGGNVYVVAVRDVHLLSKYRHQHEFIADNGQDGDKKSCHGADGKDLEIKLPIGSVLTNLDTGEKISLDKEGERRMILAGGVGGRGNESFKSFINRNPFEFTEGSLGEEAEFFIELELIADIGLIGLPSAGKTSMLNFLTNAQGKVGDYPFTTLEPNLGECFGFIIADIPGLIEGASSGKGLGHKFLRHIRRTKVLVHLVSLESDNLSRDYKIIKNELKEFDTGLLKKREIIILTKADIVDSKEVLEKKVEEMKKINPEVLTSSLYNDKSVKKIRDFILKVADNDKSAD